MSARFVSILTPILRFLYLSSYSSSVSIVMACSLCGFLDALPNKDVSCAFCEVATSVVVTVLLDRVEEDDEDEVRGGGEDISVMDSIGLSVELEGSLFRLPEMNDFAQVDLDKCSSRCFAIGVSSSFGKIGFFA